MGLPKWAFCEWCKTIRHRTRNDDIRKDCGTTNMMTLVGRKRRQRKNQELRANKNKLIRIAPDIRLPEDHCKDDYKAKCPL